MIKVMQIIVRKHPMLDLQEKMENISNYVSKVEVDKVLFVPSYN